MSKTMLYVRLIFAMLIWGSMGLFVNLVSLPSMEVAFVRFSLGAVVISLVILKGRQKLDFPNLKKNIGWLLGGGISTGLGCMLTYEAFRNLTVSMATLIFYSAPVLVIVLSPLLFKERLTATKIVGVAVAMAGMFLINGTSPLTGPNPTKGVICALLAALMYVFTVFCNKRIKNVPNLQLTLAEMLAAALVLLPIALISHQGAFVFPVGSELLILLLIGVVHGGLLYYIYFASLQQMPAQSVSLIGYLEPFSALVLSAIFLHDRLSVLQIVGAVLLLGGALYGEIGGSLLQRWRHKQELAKE